MEIPCINKVIVSYRTRFYKRRISTLVGPDLGLQKQEVRRVLFLPMNRRMAKLAAALKRPVPH